MGSGGTPLLWSPEFLLYNLYVLSFVLLFQGNAALNYLLQLKSLVKPHGLLVPLG